MGFREARPKAVEVNRAMTGRTGVEVSMVGRCRLKAPITMLLKLRCDEMLINVAVNFNLRCYSMGGDGGQIFNIHDGRWGGPRGG